MNRTGEMETPPPSEEPDFVIEAPNAATVTKPTNHALGEFKEIPINPIKAKANPNNESELPEPAPNAVIDTAPSSIDSTLDASDEPVPVQGHSIRMEIGSQDPKRPGMMPFRSVFGMFRFQNHPKKLHHGEFRDERMLQLFLEKLTTPMAKPVWVTNNEKKFRIKNEDIIFVSNDNEKMGGMQIRLSNKGEYNKAYSSKHYLHIDLYQFMNKALFDSVQQSIRAFFEAHAKPMTDAKHSPKKFTRKRITRKRYKPTLAKTRSKVAHPFHPSRRKFRKFDMLTRRISKRA